MSTITTVELTAVHMTLFTGLRIELIVPHSGKTNNCRIKGF